MNQTSLKWGCQALFMTKSQKPNCTLTEVNH